MNKKQVIKTVPQLHKILKTNKLFTYLSRRKHGMPNINPSETQMLTLQINVENWTLISD
jgi:hypothetical protein